MSKIKKYFTELLDVLKSIDTSLELISKCVRDAPGRARGRGKKAVITSHWND